MQTLEQISSKIFDAETQFDFERANAMAQAVNWRYVWSKDRTVSIDDLRTALGVQCSAALSQLRKNFESGNPSRPVAVSSGGFTVRVDFFNPENPSVNIYFGITTFIS
jgi:hypothetical protein